MQISEVKQDDVTVLVVQGRIDTHTAPQFGERIGGLAGVNGGRILVDLNGVRYMSGAGFRVLLIGARLAEQSNSRFALCALSEDLYRLFEQGAFIQLFTLYTTRDEGVAALR